MAELHQLGVTELLAAFEAREASPLDAVEACLSRIDAVDPRLNAVLSLCEGQARRAATESAKRWLAGNPRPLEGIPFGLKDIIKTAGTATTGGSVIYRNYVPYESATVAVRLAEAGAVLLAKLQTMEFAMGGNSHYGPTLNPWDTRRATGGSSSGSAVAVIAEEMPFAIGTDTGGSIRIPSLFCGITGLKPSFGAVSRHGVFPLAWTLDHVGPMARSTADVGRVLNAIWGPDVADPYSIRYPAPDMGSGDDVNLSGVRIAIPSEWFFDPLEPSVERAVSRVIAALTDLGADLREISIPHAHLADTACWVIILAEMAALHSDTIGRLDDYGEVVTRQLMINAQFVGAADYLRALRILPLIQREADAVFDVADALLVPGMPTAAPAVAEKGFTIRGTSYPWQEIISRTMSFFNVTGLPALAIPGGHDDEGLPVGVQVAAPLGADGMCLRIGTAIQRHTAFHHARPKSVLGYDSADAVNGLGVLDSGDITDVKPLGRGPDCSADQLG
jgi:aspartyl-tRNA(Asn)/glutamyl-tRNA(Gln) amidotransferase subunit A